MCGFLCGGMSQWQEAGKPISSFGILSAMELKNRLAKREVLLLDIREPNEWKEDGYIDGAQLMFFGDLPNKANLLSKDKPIAVTCSVGNRTSTALSILEQKGFKNISNVLGGMTAWTNLGYPTKKQNQLLRFSLFLV
jgi:rhodanese-related sulfurtransferase